MNVQDTEIDVRNMKRSRKSPAKFCSYIHAIFKKVNPGLGITGEAADCLDSLIKVLLKKIVANTIVLLAEVDRKTIGQKDIEHALRLTFARSLFESSTVDAVQAVNKYKADTTKQTSTRSEKAGLKLPVTRIEKILMNEMRGIKRKTDTSAVYLVAAVESVTRELYVLAGREAVALNKARLTSLHITRAVNNSDAYKQLYGDCILVLDVVRANKRRKKARAKSRAKVRSTKAVTLKPVPEVPLPVPTEAPASAESTRHSRTKKPRGGKKKASRSSKRPELVLGTHQKPAGKKARHGKKGRKRTKPARV